MSEKEKIDVSKVDLNDKKYTGVYEEKKLWKKIGEVAKKAGLEVIYYVLLLFYALQSGNGNNSGKALIIAALGYFILPLDLTPTSSLSSATVTTAPCYTG